MKKRKLLSAFVAIVSIVVVAIYNCACTQQELPEQKRVVEEYKNNGHGNKECFTGRSPKEGADYYRLLIKFGDKRYLTKHTFDCEVVDKDTLKIYFLYDGALYWLANKISVVCGYGNIADPSLGLFDKESVFKQNIIHKCVTRYCGASWFTVDRTVVSHLTAKEVKDLLKSDPSLEIQKKRRRTIYKQLMNRD